MKVILVLAALIGATLAAPQPFSLTDDIDDFLNLIDVDQLKSILEDNLQNNGDLIEIVIYLKGEEFAGIVDFVKNHDGWIALKDWLVSKNVPVDDIVTAIHDYIQGLEVGTASGDSDVNSFLNEIEAAIPIDQIVILAVQKLITSPDFRELVDRVKAESTHQLVDDVLGLDEVKGIIARLTEMGVDVEGILNTVYGALGWGSPPSSVKKVGPRSLSDDLDDFIALLPVDDIIAIVQDHVDNDPAVDAVLVYLQSDRWNDLVDEVLAKPTAVEFIEYLNNAGIPVDDILAAIRDTINGAVPGTTPDGDASLRPFLDHLESILPVDDLVALLNDKLQNSPSFQDLYITIATPEGKELVDEVLTMDEAIYIQQELEGQEVDVQGVLTVIYDFFGWGAPPVPPKANVHVKTLIAKIATKINHKKL